MKNLVTLLYLYFSFCAASISWAGDSTLIANYPAPAASYNKIVISTTASTNTLCNAANPNQGMLFMDTVSGTLKICVNVNGLGTTYAAVPYGEKCFNRFSSANTYAAGINCPTGYSQAQLNGGGNLVDSYKLNPDVTQPSGYPVYSTVCCTTGSTITP